MLSVIMLNVIMLSVIMLIVVAPGQREHVYKGPKSIIYENNKNKDYLKNI